MLSRAHLLIEKDYKRFLEEKPWGIEAEPIDACNLFEWRARIWGEKDSLWEDGIFQVYMKFSESYNDVPPVIYFHTIPFHPNINPVNGEPTLDAVEEYRNWKPGENYFGDILVATQKLLSMVCGENAVNTDALDLYNNDPNQYKEIAWHCVMHSQTLEGKTNENRFEHPVELNALVQKPCNKNAKHKTATVKKKLMFEDYHAAWSDIGTSKSLQSKSRNKFPATQNNIFGYSDHPKSLRKHYPSKQTVIEKQKQEELERIKEMRQQYLHPNSPKRNAVNNFKIPQTDCQSDEFIEEIDDLISWTDKLDITS